MYECHQECMMESQFDAMAMCLPTEYIRRKGSHGGSRGG